MVWYAWILFVIPIVNIGSALSRVGTTKCIDYTEGFVLALIIANALMAVAVWSLAT